MLKKKKKTEIHVKKQSRLKHNSSEILQDQNDAIKSSNIKLRK